MAGARAVPVRSVEFKDPLFPNYILLYLLNLSQEGLCMDAQAALDYLHTREDIASDRWLSLSLLNWCNSGFNTLKKII